MLIGERVLVVALLFLLAFAMPVVSASVVINEVMYFPEDNTNSKNEWIELYTNEEINMTAWSIEVKENVNKLYNCSNPEEDILFENKSFILIISNTSYNVENINTSKICTFKNKMGSYGLANDKSNISLKNESGGIIDFFNYTYLMGANGNNNSLQLVNGSWCASLPTPGTANSCPSPNQAPVANFTYLPANPTANQAVTFDANSSSDADGNITSYLWNFGDSATATGITAQHAYTTAGNYSVNLTVTDNNNASASSTKTISVLQNQTQQNKTSILEIVYAPAEAYFGSTIEINISVYRNDTAKYAVYLYIESREGEKVTDKITFYAKNSTNNKSTNYPFNASLEIEEKCDGDENLSFRIILEGLDERINKSITLMENSTLCLPDFQYIVIPAATAKINETFSTKVRIVNNKNTDTEFDVWSYVQRGTKCYSCVDDKKDENLNHTVVEANSSEEILLYNTVKEAEPGDYPLKVKILSEDGEESFSKTSTILLEAAVQEIKGELSQQTQAENNLNAQNIANVSQTNNSITGKAIYNSKIGLNKNRVEIIFVSIVLLAALYFLFRQKIIMMRENGV